MFASWVKQLIRGDESWSLNCDFHNWTVHDLSTNEARVILETLRDSEKATVLVWKPGWAVWKSLRDGECAELLHTRIVKIKAPVIPSVQDFDSEITAVRPVKAETPFVTRKFNRFEVDYPARVVSGTQEFATRILDLSEGGLRIKDPVPDWVAGYSTVIITIEDGRDLELMCSLAEDQRHLKTRLEIVPSENQSEFLAWFRAHPKFKEE
jgi:hypothetical protein